MSGWPTVLVGCGNVGSSFAEDPITAQHYQYVSHAQVLRDHPAFTWAATIDTDAQRAATVAELWGVAAHTDDANQLPDRESISVAVLAIPPGSGRIKTLEAFPNLKAVVAEKPLGISPQDTEAFCAYCTSRDIAVQVNLPRRCDPLHRSLSDGGLQDRIGTIHGGAILYGNGLRNNGLHMVDLARALLGEVTCVQAAAPPAKSFVGGPIPHDTNLAFMLSFAKGVVINGLPLHFEAYRENAIQVWGERGSLTLAQEGLRIGRTPISDHRALSGERELSQDETVWETTSIGTAFRAVYDNLANHLKAGDPLMSPPEEAIRSERVIEAIFESSQADGAPVRPE